MAHSLLISESHPFVARSLELQLGGARDEVPCGMIHGYFCKLDRNI